MKEIYIIRHAESLSNAGEKTDNHTTVPLSEKGKEQAKELAKNLNIKPELIVISPYSRTRETAECFILKNPNIPVETWDVHEFTYLNPEIYKTTTIKERTNIAYNYWDNASIHFRDGEGAETFAELIERMNLFLHKLKSRKEKTITIFSHGRFIHGLQLYIQKIKELGRENLTEEEIADLKNMQAANFKNHSEFPIKNISVHKIEI